MEDLACGIAVVDGTIRCEGGRGGFEQGRSMLVEEDLSRGTVL